MPTLKVLKCNIDILYISNMKMIDLINKKLIEYAELVIKNYQYRHRK